ncbi:hypothetical protein V6Z11_D13G041700 [Gossypium hirsutum]
MTHRYPPRLRQKATNSYYELQHLLPGNIRDKVHRSPTIRFHHHHQHRIPASQGTDKPSYSSQCSASNIKQQPVLQLYPITQQPDESRIKPLPTAAPVALLTPPSLFSLCNLSRGSIILSLCRVLSCCLRLGL